MPQEKSPIIQRMESFLLNAWEQDPEASRYAAAVATQLIQFASGAERAIKKLAERVAELEAALHAATSEPTSAPVEAAQRVQGQAAPARRQAAPSGTQGMVRLGGDGTPLSPEETAAEEAADMQFHGAIDESRYVPIGSAPKGPPTVTVGAPPPPVSGQG